MRKVNKCFYFFTMTVINYNTNNINEIEFIGSYCGILKEINKIIDNVFNTYLNELYIIDE